MLKVNISINNVLVAAISIACILVLIVVLPSGCTQPENATRILTQAGYTDIDITGWRPFMAGKDENFSTGFRAKSANGSEVSGSVTYGFFKGSTIRMD